MFGRKEARTSKLRRHRRNVSLKNYNAQTQLTGPCTDHLRFIYSSTKSWQVGARAPSVAGTPITQVDLRPPSTDSESTPKIPKIQFEIGSIFEGPTRTAPPPQVASFVNERASSKRNHDASLANSYAARAYCRVISEIGTGLRNMRNMRTCNRWVG